MILYSGIRYPVDRPSPVNVSRIDHGVMPIVNRMHLNGIRVDVPHMNDLADRLTAEMAKTQAEITALVGKVKVGTKKTTEHLNPLSPLQVSQLLFHDLRVQGDRQVRMTDTGNESTGADELQIYESAHPVVKLILDYRHFDKLRGTYAEPMAKVALRSPDGRAHTRFKMTRAATGRFASEDPNCFDGTTEVLTRAGWVSFETAYAVRPAVAQWIPSEGGIEFVQPTAWHTTVPEDIVHIYSPEVSLRVTPDHRCLMQNRDTGELKVFPAIDYPTQWGFDRAASEWAQIGEGGKLSTHRIYKNVYPNKGNEVFYCCSVPSTFLVVRRRRDIMVTGNCQNIPTRKRKGQTIEWGKEIRRGFTAGREGAVLISMDLSQIEMRWAAHYSQEPVMLEGYHTDGFDMHSKTAFDCGLCGPKPCDPDNPIHKSQHRLPAKTLGFGILYLMGPQGLQLSIVDAGGELWPLSKCEKQIESFYEARPYIRAWQEKQFLRARRHGMVWDLLGRHRMTPHAKSILEWLARAGMREAANHPIQGGAGESLKIAMIEIWYKLIDYNRGLRVWRVEPLLTVHDELIFEAESEATAQDWISIAQPVMEGAVPLDVPVQSSADVAYRWGDLK